MFMSEVKGEERLEFDARLLEAATAVLAQHGLAGLTLVRLAEALGGSRMTLHRRGITREDVVARLSLLAVQEYQQAVWPALTGSRPARDRLDQALRATCTVADKHAKLLVGLYADDGGIFHDVEAAEPNDQAAALATRAVFVEPLARLLRDGAHDGTLECADPDEMATVLFNQVGWTYLALREGQRWQTQRAEDVVVSNALAAVSGSIPRSASTVKAAGPS